MKITDNGETVTVEKVLPTETYSVEVDKEDWILWQSGTVIQDAIPYLDVEQREFLITGLTPTQWYRIMGDEK